MKHYYLNIYDNFTCLMDRCPNTCCRGWDVCIDDKTYELYTQEKGTFGLRLMLNTYKKEGIYCIKTHLGKCSFETKEGLCQLHRDNKTIYQPLVCREYPRRTLDFGEFTETSLELACPAIARLFIEADKPFTMIEKTSGREVLWTLGNQDLAFLDFLGHSRQLILDIIYAKNISVYDCFKNIYAYTKSVHSQLMLDNLTEAAKITQDIVFSSSDYMFLPIKLIDHCIVHEVEHPRLRITNPDLFKVLKGYHKHFDKLSESQATELINSTLNTIISRNIVKKDKYLNHFAFSIYTHYLTCYEDYHILKIILLCMACTHILMIQDVVNFLDNRGFSIEEQANSLASLEKRIRHNQWISAGFFDRLRKEFLSLNIDI